MQRPTTSLTPADAARTMPWRNGGGSTTELAIEPLGGDLATGFDWRVSLAEVGTSGPFSAFPGYRRLIALVEGEGMTLVFDDGERHALEQPLAPFGFDGGRALRGELHAGPVRDFNLIYDPARVRASLWPLHGGVDRAAVDLVADTIVFVCLAGGLDIDLRTLGEGHSLLPGEVLRIDGAGSGVGVVLEQTHEDTLGFLLAFERLPPP